MFKWTSHFKIYYSGTKLFQATIAITTLHFAIRMTNTPSIKTKALHVVSNVQRVKGLP